MAHLDFNTERRQTSRLVLRGNELRNVQEALKTSAFAQPEAGLPDHPYAADVAELVQTILSLPAERRVFSQREVQDACREAVESYKAAAEAEAFTIDVTFEPEGVTIPVHVEPEDEDDDEFWF